MDMNMLTQFSFYFGAASMLCASVFFFFERGEVAAKWRTSVTVAGLVTFIAFFHYLTMRDSSVWAASAPNYGELTSLRYVDWLVTVPLQIVEFYLILKVVGKGYFFCVLAIISSISCYVSWWITRRNS
ncbi:MAG: hypothetical protein CM15mP129_03850 [Chloroflexota bacterium]|nr:MAG: hypothetical protein CM15mP129_03850 [Chloroflexota bacterium]